jgi:hypothetical protein
MLLIAILLIWAFSLSGWAVDFFFLRAKLRVVIDADALQDLALNVAMGETTTKAQYETLRELLHISGEKPKKVGWAQFWNAWVSVVWIYLTTPLVGTVIFLLLWSW